MMKYKNISGKRKSECACFKARRSHLVAADVSRRSGRSRANFGCRGTLWTTDQAGMVIQNPPTHVGSYEANCRIGLLQVVDFHDISGYFAWVQFLKVRKQLMQLVDFHDSFRYFSRVFVPRPRETLN